MSRPFPFPALKKDHPSYDHFIENVLLSAVDLHRSVSHFRLVGVPSTSTSSGAFGMFAIDSSYLYVCVDTDTWTRLTLSSW